MIPTPSFIPFSVSNEVIRIGPELLALANAVGHVNEHRSTDNHQPGLLRHAVILIRIRSRSDIAREASPATASAG
jgi:hypothetical protein